jgi:Fe-S oxidoreductase
MQVSFDFETEHGIRQYAEFVDRAADLVIRYGGSLSGEHGDGQSRGALLPKMFGDELMRAFAEFKAIWDPQTRMNPHKVIDAYQPTENLRLGADYRPAQPATFFSFADDNHSFAKAALRCIGLGECRKHDYGTMCPSYMATLEERHSTRGRAHLLWELLQGEVLRDSWKSEEVKESLDLCLSCKACKSECPTNVDIATYRAEFLAHYYETRRRPVAAYAFGLIDTWAALGANTPRLANLLLKTPGVTPLIKQLLGLAPQRAMPQLAAKSFAKWARSMKVPAPGEAGASGKPEVILWADTFNNYFHPATSRAAFAVLEAAGRHVTVPSGRLCCGRPLYDFGMLDRAKRYLQQVMDHLGPQIDAGVPIVVLEPSCASVFRDELRGLFPGDGRAERLRKQTFLLSEFLERHAPEFRPRLERGVLLHGHCHHKALMKMTDEESVLKKMGAAVTSPDAGCCGMAGPFGFDAEKYELSMAIGERVLLPAVRTVPADGLIVSDGFSCREQIYHATGRRPLHLAEAIQIAME